MNQYLLLRDNKQSGPYTMEELVAKGLKPYDLVWIEGKSAAWRYPSEITELKPYAPAVEEQPYDRFYKRPGATTQAEQASKKTTTEMPAYRSAYETATLQAVKEAESQATARVPQFTVVHPKKIYVTLPAGAVQTRQELTSENAVTGETSFSEKISTTIGNADGIKESTRPVVAINNNTTCGRYYANEGTTLSDTLEQLNMPAVGHRSRGRLMTGLIAACLLLFGVVIGLAISNYRQSSQSKALEDLVRNIQEREKNKQANPPARHTIPPSMDFSDAGHQATDNKPEPGEELKETTKEVPVSLAARKESITPPAKDNQLPPAIPTGHSADGQELKANTAVLEVQKEEKISYQQAAIESARKNIHQLLLVEPSKYKTGLLGGISDLRLTLSNNSHFPLDEVEVEVRYFGPESKLVKTQKLLFSDLAPGEQKTLEAPKTNRGVSIDYAITRINSRVLGLAQVRTEFHN